MNDELQQVQITIEEAERRIELRNKWEKLLANPEFKELVTEGYLEKDIVRITMSLKPGDDNKIANDMLKAKMIFSRYVGNIMEDGYQATQSLQEHNELLKEMDQEG